MTHQTIQSKVTTRANQLVSKHGRKRAFIMAWAAEKLIAEMYANESVEFEFIKADETIRIAHGTRVMTVIEKHWAPVGQPSHDHPDVVRYFDNDKLQWRSFRIDRLVAVAA